MILRVLFWLLEKSPVSGSSSPKSSGVMVVSNVSASPPGEVVLEMEVLCDSCESDSTLIRDG